MPSNPNFDRFHARVSDRLSGKTDLSWFLSDTNPTPFTPDIFTLGTFGRTAFECRLNRWLSVSAPFIWRRLVWPMIATKTVGLLDQTTKPTYSEKEATSLYRSWLNDLRHNLRRGTSIPTEATFTEIYLLLQDCIRSLATVVGGPADRFGAFKTEHSPFFIRWTGPLFDELCTLEAPLAALLVLCTRANWMDVTTPNISLIPMDLAELSNDLLDQTDGIEDTLKTTPYFHLKYISALLSQPQTILYELDNHPEVFMDLVFVRWLLHTNHKVILCCKSSPVLNDVTLSDLKTIQTHASFTWLKNAIDDLRVKIVTAGPATVGKYIYEASDAYKSAYSTATVQILKGQGSFQSQPPAYNYKKPVIYLTGNRAPIIRYSMKKLFGTRKAPTDDSIFCYLKGTFDE
ncbi:DUF89 family protein [bacterium]|nr:DUF89 family protein [bacterium]